MEFYTELLNNYKVVKKTNLSDGSACYQHTRINNEDRIVMNSNYNGIYINFSTDIEFLKNKYLHFEKSTSIEYIDFIIKTFLIASNSTCESFITNCIKNNIRIHSSEILTGTKNGDDYIGWNLTLNIPPEFKDMVFSFYIIDRKRAYLDLMLYIKYYKDDKSYISLNEAKAIIERF